MKRTLLVTAALCSATVAVSGPALAQMKTSSPATAAEAAAETAAIVPVADASASAAVATDSVTASGSMAVATGSVTAATDSLAIASGSMAVATSSAKVAEAPSGGFSLPTIPKLPVGIALDYQFDGMAVPGLTNGGTSLNTGGIVSVPTSQLGQTVGVPALVAADPAITTVTGSQMGIDLSFLFVGGGYRMGSFTVPGESKMPYRGSAPTGALDAVGMNLTPFLPSSYNDLYGRLGPLKAGFRNETYADGSYTSLMGGLGMSIINLFDIVSFNLEGMAGIAQSKPASVPANVAHVPVDADANLKVGFGPVHAKVGYRMTGAVNGAADPGALLSVFTNPASLVTDQAGSAEKLAALTATRFGLYSGPYLSFELSF